jgi:hypothetical protein
MHTGHQFSPVLLTNESNIDSTHTLFENIGIIRTGSIPRTWTYSFCATAGLAKDSSDSSDFGSLLTITGKREVTDIAKSLKELGVQFNFVITSPLKRAHQTASSWP